MITDKCSKNCNWILQIIQSPILLNLIISNLKDNNSTLYDFWIRISWRLIEVDKFF